ncbi:MAG: hypothetical protein WCB46_09210 [Methanoregula sp.]
MSSDLIQEKTAGLRPYNHASKSSGELFSLAVLMNRQNPPAVVSPSSDNGVVPFKQRGKSIT